MFYVMVRYYDLIAHPGPDYRGVIHRSYTLDPAPYIVDFEAINDHAHIVPNADSPGRYFEDVTQLRDMRR
jgi:hypothetical protein